jgi:hypothetical protein
VKCVGEVTTDDMVIHIRAFFFPIRTTCRGMGVSLPAHIHILRDDVNIPLFFFLLFYFYFFTFWPLAVCCITRFVHHFVYCNDTIIFIVLSHKPEWPKKALFLFFIPPSVHVTLIFATAPAVAAIGINTD